MIRRPTSAAKKSAPPQISGGQAIGPNRAALQAKRDTLRSMHRAETEIRELHDFFEHWFNGAIEPEALDRFEAALAPGFVLVAPDGRRWSRTQTIDRVTSAYDGEHLEIEIRDVRIVDETGARVTAQYEELHNKQGSRTVRLSTVVFARSEPAPNGLLWLLVHETWKPADSE